MKLLLTLVLLAVSLTTHSQTIPSDADFDAMVSTADAAYNANNFSLAADQYAAATAKREQVPDVVTFHYGVALFETKKFKDAMYELALYMGHTGQGGKFYAEALKRYRSALSVHNAASGEDTREEVEMLNMVLGASNVASFQDCNDCPQMISIPKKSPIKNGTIAKKKAPLTGKGNFALGKYAVTFDEWDACLKDGGCAGYRPSDEGWGRGNRPVININWNDAQNYIVWLSKKTGKSYRLPTNAEWTFAAETGYGKYNLQHLANGNYANCYGCGSQWAGKSTAPVGSFIPNKFGLFDMFGNVNQWLSDCIDFNYGKSGLPKEGKALFQKNCPSHGLRGGDWLSDVDGAISYGSFNANERGRGLGFRLAMSL